MFFFISLNISKEAFVHFSRMLNELQECKDRRDFVGSMNRQIKPSQDE